MLSKSKTFRRIKFRPEDLRRAIEALPPESQRSNGEMEVQAGDTTWSFDGVDEFFAEYRKESTTSTRFHLILTRADEQPGVRLSGSLFLRYETIGAPSSVVSVRLASRSEIERVFEVFEAAAGECSIPEPQTPKPEPPEPCVFIGHGRDPAWRDLKDQLHDKHGIEVVAYETGARAGLTIKEFLEEYVVHAGFALLIHSPEDADAKGLLHARENVIHETGLFQGWLGFRRAIVLREEGCEAFSNLAGVQEIRYPRGGIRETFGDVLATLKREFGT